MPVNFTAEQLKGLKVVKNLKVVLKDMEPLVTDPQYLWNGRELSNFSLRPREIWANWLICIVLRHIHKSDITFMDDDKGDGFIVDKDRRVIVPTEHVSALDIPLAKNLPLGEQRVIDAINKKVSKGKKYAEGKLLVVFFDGAGEFYRSLIRENIYRRHNFEAIFCVGLLESNENGYSYSVTEFRDSFGDQSITHVVEIDNSFDSWRVFKQMK